MSDLIALAKQAGAGLYGKPPTPVSIIFSDDQLQAFADPIKKDAFRDGYEKGIAGFMEAVKLEREQCAVACDELAELNRTSPTNSMWQWAECAAAIRARTTTC